MLMPVSLSYLTRPLTYPLNPQAATDGDTQSCFRSGAQAVDTTDAWWRVDLQKATGVDQVKVWTSDDCGQDRWPLLLCVNVNMIYSYHTLHPGLHARV